MGLVLFVCCVWFRLCRVVFGWFWNWIGVVSFVLFGGGCFGVWWVSLGVGYGYWSGCCVVVVCCLVVSVVRGCLGLCLWIYVMLVLFNRIGLWLFGFCVWSCYGLVIVVCSYCNCELDVVGLFDVGGLKSVYILVFVICRWFGVMFR